MKCVYHKINFDLKEKMLEELPFTKLLYEQEEALWDDVKDLMIYPIKNQNAMPFFTFSSDAAGSLYEKYSETYQVMLKALDKLFKEDIEVIKHFYGKEFIEKFPYFVDYAKYTYHKKHPAIYGRFDSAIDPNTDEITGIYEFNGDTPVMLFESVILQNLYTQEITGDVNAQFNEYFPLLSDFIKSYNKHRQFAVICDLKYIEDTVTCETLTQIINESHINGCVFEDIENLNYDFSHLSKGQSPFFVGSKYSHDAEHINVTDIFLLSPWEEMIENDYEQKYSAFKNWEKWCDHVNFYEPAWRWFMSNKGFLAYITHLQETDEEFKLISSHLPFLKTYMTPNTFIKNHCSYVSKPLVGRLSNNISIYDKDKNFEDPFRSGGVYENTQCVYQEYCEPYKVEGRQKFIACCWLSPLLTGTGNYNSLESQAASFCIREFDNPVLDIGNERFIPHLISDLY